MASGMTNYNIMAILRNQFGSVANTIPAKWYIGASTTAINQDGTGATEPTDPAYARVEVDNNTSSWEDIPADFGRRNLIDIVFPIATTAWGTITHIFITDSLTGGNMRYYGQLTVAKPVSIDDVLRIDASNLQIKFLPTV